MADNTNTERQSGLGQRVTAVEVHYKTLDNRLDDIQESFIKRFDEIKLQLSQVSRDFALAQRFPVATFISAGGLILGIVIALGSGFIGKPLTEVKKKQEWILEQLWTMNYELGKSEEIMRRNKDGITRLDTNLQREMDDRDEALRNDLDGAIEKSAADIRHLEGVISALQNNYREHFTESDFRWAYENYLDREKPQ